MLLNKCKNCTHVLGLAVVGEACPGVVEGVDEGEGHGAGDAAGEDVLAELLGVARVLGGAERRLDRVLEGEVQGLRGEVPKEKIYER